MSSGQVQTHDAAEESDFEKVERVVEIVDLVADANDADPKDVLHATFGKIRRRDGDE